MRFVCDSTVVKLAKLLRAAGFDTACVNKPDIPRVLSLSKEEQRIIVSRNSKYLQLELAGDFCHLTADEPLDQFRAIVTDLKLPLVESQFLTRCLECNELLCVSSVADVRERLYEFVARTQERIFLCPNCDRLYWHATHAKAMIKRLLAIKSELASKPAAENG
jgi:uncharacterized protein